jgi:hypothetical protein
MEKILGYALGKLPFWAQNEPKVIITVHDTWKRKVCERATLSWSSSQYDMVKQGILPNRNLPRFRAVMLSDKGSNVSRRPCNGEPEQGNLQKKLDWGLAKTLCRILVLVLAISLAVRGGRIVSACSNVSLISTASEALRYQFDINKWQGHSKSASVMRLITAYLSLDDGRVIIITMQLVNLEDWTPCRAQVAELGIFHLSNLTFCRRTTEHVSTIPKYWHWDIGMCAASCLRMLE